jgi:O-antigen/teichoic acid export membrane protein
VYFLACDLRPVLCLGRCSREVVAGLLSLAPTFFGILLLAACINRLDFVMLSKLGTLEQVGLYAAPYRIYEMALMVPSVLALALFPLFAASAAAPGAQLEDLARQVLRVSLTAGLPCAIALAFLAEPAMVLLFGDAFAPAAPVLATLAILPVLAAADQALTMVLLATGHEQLDLAALGCAGLFYVIALAILIPSQGILGAALATAAATTVQLTVRYRLIRTVMGLRSMMDIVLRPTLAGAVMVVTAWAVRPLSIALALVAGGAVYAATLAASKAVTRADLRWVRGALQRPGEAS